MQTSERKVYINGKMVPENEAAVSVFDIGFMYGATFYESIRTFHHEFFKLDEHLVRLERSLRYAGLEALISKSEFAEIVRKVLDANIHLTDKDDDIWVSAEVTPGVGFPHPLMKQKDKRPTVVAYSSSLPHAEYVRCYSEGKSALISRVRNVPPQVVDSRSKNRSRLHYFLAKRETMQRDPDAFTLLLDIAGNITESSGANFFIVADDILYTPTTGNILNGITRQTVIELAEKIDLPVRETDINLYDVCNADEAFFTTTTYCILPVSGVEAVKVGNNVPGAWTERLLNAWSEMVGLDIVKQAQKFGRRDRKK